MSDHNEISRRNGNENLKSINAGMEDTIKTDMEEPMKAGMEDAMKTDMVKPM